MKHIMDSYEEAFVEEFEKKTATIHFLSVIKDNLTGKGKELYESLEKWTIDNVMKYLEITGK